MARVAVDRVEARAAEVDVSALHTSGAEIAGEFRCSSCGYGIVSRGVLPPCPLCPGAVWADAPWRSRTRVQGPV